MALTFDDGPDPDFTAPLLDVLRRHGALATFFVCGAAVERWPDLLRQIVSDGHAVGGHSYTHRPMTKIAANEYERELDDTHALIEQIGGISVTMFRPPYGDYDERVLEQVKSRKLTPVLWTSNGLDWSSPPAREVARTVLRGTTRNSIVLLHDGFIALRLRNAPELAKTSRTGTVQGVDLVLRRFRRRGLQVTPLAAPRIRGAVGEP